MSDDNVVPFHKAPKAGDKSFMACSCTGDGDDGTDYVPLVLVGDPPVIIALVCPACEAELPVVNGTVGVSK